MRSSLIVISWWSNCLGLTCLHKLTKYTDRRPIYIVQVGKTEHQKTLFRRLMPPVVNELFYPPGQPVEHSRVISYVIRNQLSHLEGVWFVDHDLFIHENWEPWLSQYEQTFQVRQICLGLTPERKSPAITQPTFWLSPANFPRDISLDPVPFQSNIHFQRPDLYYYTGSLKMPEKDTLVQAKEILESCELVDYFAFGTFPANNHLSGLFLFAGKPLEEPDFQEWQQITISQFSSFFRSCPPEWLAIEDPTLLERLQNFREITNFQLFGSSAK